MTADVRGQARRPFRFGVQGFAAASGAGWRDAARAAEDLGYSTLFAADHYFGPGKVAETSRHSPVGIAPLSALATAAAVTKTLRVGGRVFNIDFHHPVVLAKELATLDLMTDGRVEVGLGAGWIKAEYESVNMPMDSPGVRIARLAEVVQVLKAHWSGAEIDLDLENYQVHGFAGSPMPAQRPHPPILIGGGRQKVLRLAGSVADIVSLNWDNSSGNLGTQSLTTSSAEATTRQLDWVREGAGERFDQLEIEVGAYFVYVGTKPTADFEAMAARYGFEEADLVGHPHALMGSVDAICEALEERRERFGISYITVTMQVLESFAPIVARLAGR